MGFALAEQAAKLGAEVTLISGPVNLPTPSNVKRIDVLSAQQMHQAAVQHATEHDIFIGCAAVADYRAAEVAEQKMKKVAGTDELMIRMVKNPDIIATVASLPENRPFTVGFAAETQDVEKYAMDKLARKNLDLICANDVSQTGIGFNSNDNVLSLYWANGQQHFSLASKQILAKGILEQINELTQ